MKVIHLWDGLKSLLAAVATVVLCGVPAWYCHVAIGAKLAPTWVYGAVAGLVIVGVLMSVAFLGKAIDGVSPSRDRKRR